MSGEKIICVTTGSRFVSRADMGFQDNPDTRKERRRARFLLRPVR